MLNFISKTFKRKIIYLSIFSVLIIILLLILYYKISFFHDILSEITIIFDKFLEFIRYPIIESGNLKLSILNIFIFLIIISIGFTLAGYYKKFIYSIRKKYDNLSYGSTTLLANIGYYLIITIIGLSSVKFIGVDLSSFTLIAGALSVGIGFGLQNIISNFISGIILMFEKSIKIGDYVELSDGNRGKVMDIRIRSTTIKTNDNIDIIIPNQKFIEKNITNWTLNDSKRRFKIPFGVAYGTKIKDLEKVILTGLKESNLNFMKSGQYTPLVVMKSMNNSSIDFELYVWIRGEDTIVPNRTKSKFLKLIYTVLNENNITIPFPQTDLHIKDSIPLEIKINNLKE